MPENERKDEQKEFRLGRGGTSATGSNAGPSRFPMDSEDAPMGTTSRMEPELRGETKRGSRMDAERRSGQVGQRPRDPSASGIEPGSADASE